MHLAQTYVAEYQSERPIEHCLGRLVDPGKTLSNKVRLIETVILSIEVFCIFLCR